MGEQAERKTIHPLIFAGKTEIPPGYAAAIQTSPNRDDTSHDAFRRLVGKYERPGKLISGILGESSEVECKYRWMPLSHQRRLR
jgi:hypothetical protein